ncbi:MAG: hypothetical protein MH472_13385 [Bacteroidia bacterium]|nr:hypothetical protein [Bacteroidia bacterium]
MKKSIQVSILLLFFLFLGSVKLSAQTVYVTENGKKYHAKNCSLAKTGKKGLSMAEAKKGGFEPCKNCKADAIKPEEKKSAQPKAKKK